MSLRAAAATAAVALAIVCTAGAFAQEAPAAEPAATPAPFTRGGADLSRTLWFASADLPPTATVDQIRAGSARTTPTATLRTDPGSSGTLFALFEVAAPPTSGAALTIGDIDGTDETWFNGTLIGSTRGWGVTDHGIPRVYPVEQKLIRTGINVLAVRMSGTFGAGTFGIQREPITFGFVPVPPVTSPWASSSSGGGLPGIAEKDAREAIAASEPASTSTAAIFRKRPGFGRFGHLMHDGLPALSEITPTRISNRGGPRFDVGLDRVESLEIARGAGDPGIDGWHKLVRVKGPCGGQPVTYTMLQHLWYPGGILTFERGAALQLRVRFPGGKGASLPLTEAEAGAVFPGLANASFTAFLFHELGPGTAPAVLAVTNGAANVTQAEGHLDVTVSRAEGGKPAKVHIFFPLGMGRADLSSAKPTRFLDTASAVEPGAAPEETVRRWMRLGLNEPTGADEYAQVLAQDGVVRIYQVARHAAPDGVAAGDPFLFPPPQVLFAKRELKYPVVCPETTPTGVLSFSGPMEALVSTPATTAPGALRVFHYDLPIPPAGERGLVALPEREGLVALANESFGDMGANPRANGVDVFYKGRTQGFQAFSYLSPENRKKLLDNTSLVVPAGLAQSAWNEETEPFSGIRYWWTYFIEGPYFGRFDQDWGNGLSLYGLYTAVKYTGAWELVLQNWPAVERMYSWFPATDDWEWMRASNGEHGHGTGAGDCASASHVANLSYAKLARDSGRVEDFEYGLYAAARSAVFLLNRLAYNPFAQANGFKEEKGVVLGFHEGQGFLSGELDGYPWNATSLISGNGVQPEDFDLYVKFAPAALTRYERTFEQAFPDWADGGFSYGRRTIYHDNSGYITLPHIYLRARLGTDSFEQLLALLGKARANRHLWWLAPPVVAEVLNSRFRPAVVADWGRCAFLGATISREQEDRRRARVELKFDNRVSPDQVVLAMPRRPSSATINDGPIPLTDFRFEDDQLMLRLRRPGVNTVVVHY